MKNSPLSILFCSFFILSSGLYAQPDTELYEPKQFHQAEGTLNYRILYPENFDADQKYPVLLFLHGAGERGSDNEKQLIHGSKLFLDSLFRRDFPCVVIFPQCTAEDYWANVSVDRSSYPLNITFKDEGDPTQAMSLVMALMDSIYSLTYSKGDQLYVGGLSMGGMGTFEILWRKPEMFAAAFPICGGGHPATVSKYASRVSLWVFHGAKDDVVLPSYSTDMVIALQKAGGDVKYTLYKEANHNSWDSAFSEPGLFSWLFSNKQR